MQTSATKPTLHSAAPRRARFVVLAGVMVSSLFQAGVSYAKLVADPTDELADITYWLMGSLTGASMRDITMVFPIMLVGCATLFILRWRINILTMGDDEAPTMVLSKRRLRAFGNPHDVITSELISELSTYCTDAYNKTVTTMENIPENERVRMAYLLGDDSAWKGIAAIDSGNYYQVPNVPYCWLNNPPTVNQLMGLQWLPRLLYPDAFDDSIEDVTRAYYSTMYNYDLSDAEIADLLKNATRKAQEPVLRGGVGNSADSGGPPRTREAPVFGKPRVNASWEAKWPAPDLESQPFRGRSGRKCQLKGEMRGWRLGHLAISGSKWHSLRDPLLNHH